MVSAAPIPALPTPAAAPAQTPAAASPALPPLSDRDLILLNHYLANQQTLFALAASAGLTLPQLAVWRKRPEIAQAIADHLALESETFTFTAAAARNLLIANLSQLLVTAPDPIERRRVAQSLLRAINPPRPPRDPADAAPVRPKDTRRSRVDDLLDSLVSADGTVDRVKLAELATQIDAEHDEEDDEELDQDADQERAQATEQPSQPEPAKASQSPQNNPTPDDDNDNGPANYYATPESIAAYRLARGLPARTLSEAAIYRCRRLRAVETGPPAPRRAPEDADLLPKPSLDLNHQQVIETVLTAFKNNTTPVPDAGLKTLFNFATETGVTEIGHADYPDLESVFRREPYAHLVNLDSFSIPPQRCHAGYFSAHCLIQWYHVHVTKAGKEVTFEIGVCKQTNKPDLPLHLATLALPCGPRPFQPP